MLLLRKEMFFHLISSANEIKQSVMIVDKLCLLNLQSYAT